MRGSLKNVAGSLTLTVFSILFQLFFSCSTPAPVLETPLDLSDSSGQSPREGGIADEIRRLVEQGSPPSLLRALDLIRSRDLGQSEFGRVMNAAAATLMRRLYPEISVDLPTVDLPLTHPYSRILKDAENGAYTPASASSSDYLELVLPFIAFLNETRSERLVSAVPELNRASEINQSSVLDPYFRGIIAERSGDYELAMRHYSSAYSRSADCYPAALGMARVYTELGNDQESIQLLTDLLLRYPDNLRIKRELAFAYYEAGDWSRAEGPVAEILQRDSHDARFLLMRAHILVEQGLFIQAQPPLDAYASVDPENRLYLFLRARVQFEGFRNRDAALNYLRALLRTYPGDLEASAYAAGLLLESVRPEDQQEGRVLLETILNASSPPLSVFELALKDAIRRGAWNEAVPFMNRLLSERRSSDDLLNAYYVYEGLDNPQNALKFAKELYDRNSSDENSVFAYISALIGAGNRDEASRMIESRLPNLSGGSLKSRYFYLRSRLRDDQEAALNDLRSSLFENPRNLDALIAMLEIYHQRRDERRAVYYLKQALALDPDNPGLRIYQREYAAALGTAP